MVEYGSGVGAGAGQVGGGHAATQVDMGGDVARFLSNTADAMTTMPPGQLLLLIVGVFIGFMILKRAL